MFQIDELSAHRMLQYLEENLGALKLKLMDEDVAALRKIAEEADNTLGDRYSSASFSLLYVDTPEL